MLLRSTPKMPTPAPAISDADRRDLARAQVRIRGKWDAFDEMLKSYHAEAKAYRRRRA